MAGGITVNVAVRFHLFGVDEDRAVLVVGVLLVKGGMTENQAPVGSRHKGVKRNPAGAVAGGHLFHHFIAELVFS